MIKSCSGFTGELYFNKEYPDGTQQKLLDTTRINELGWAAKIPLNKGIKGVCADYEKQIEQMVMSI
jgi:GDP-L-fucose synthase